jgi:NADH-quinone oxidoreductase subunit E
LLGQTKQALNTKESELRAEFAKRELLRAQVAERDARIRELEKPQTVEAELRSRVAELERQLGEHADARERTLVLERRAAEAETSKARAERRLAELDEERGAQQTRIEELEAKLAEGEPLAARVRELETMLARRSVPPAAPVVLDERGWDPNSAEDDLTEIRGIGPKYERQLRAIGIQRYAQIAAWSDAEIEDVAKKLKLRGDRIRRDGWVESARRLAAKE